MFLVAFLGLFVIVGTATGYFLSFQPLYRAYQAQSWTPTACEVISSRVVRSDDTYRPEIVYRYVAAGRQYTADRYNFLPGSSSDKTVPEAVAKHSAGTRFECYVDPADPTNAVINRTTTLWYYFGIPFFVMFAGIPGAIGLFVMRSKRRDRSATERLTTQTVQPGMAGQSAFQTHAASDSRFASASTAVAGEAGPLILKPSSSPIGKLIGITLICLFWNGIVGLFTFFEYRAFMQGESVAWFLALFMLLFQLVGLGLLAAVPYQMLALTNPRPIITLSRTAVPLGGSVSFAWELSGAAHRVSHLQMVLRGQEEARYRRGTDTKTDTHDFFKETLVNSTHAMNIARGSGTIRIPADSMHTFTADNNKVTWTLQVTGAIARWPDIDDTFDITVRPV